MQAWETGTDFRTLLEHDPEMTLDARRLDEAFDLARSLRHVERFAAALDEIELDQDPRVSPARLNTEAGTPTSRHEA